jgi:hypothetical protein
MNQLSALIDSALPDGTCFFFFIGKAGNTETSGFDSQYGSNFRRVDALNVMKEFILKNGHQDEWLENMVIE